jgi:hypothetical protein
MSFFALIGLALAGTVPVGLFLGLVVMGAGRQRAR